MVLSKKILLNNGNAHFMDNILLFYPSGSAILSMCFMK